MDSKSRINKSTKQSGKMLTLPTETRDKTKMSSFEISNERQEITTPDLNNRKKLILFISDKNKIFFKSYFDHKGTKKFLNDKEEAMKKIEINENIENVKYKSDKLVQNNIKIKKMKSVGIALKKNKLAKEESIKKKKKRNKNKSTKFLSGVAENKTIKMKKQFGEFEIDEFPKWESLTPDIGKKGRKLLNDEKTNDKINDKNENNNEKKEKNNAKNEKHKKGKNLNLKNKTNIDKSLNSINTVDSKLFNNKTEYEIYKNFATKDDAAIFEDILCELDVNKK